MAGSTEVQRVMASDVVEVAMTTAEVEDGLTSGREEGSELGGNASEIEVEDCWSIEIAVEDRSEVVTVPFHEIRVDVGGVGSGVWVFMIPAVQNVEVSPVGC